MLLVNPEYGKNLNKYASQLKLCKKKIGEILQYF